jgi:hypothetical protein
MRDGRRFAHDGEDDHERKQKDAGEADEEKGVAEVGDAAGGSRGRRRRAIWIAEGRRILGFEAVRGREAHD